MGSAVLSAFMEAAVLSALLLSSCNEVELLPVDDDLNTLEAFAYPPQQTKVLYEEDESGNLVGNWETGDIIYGLSEEEISFRMQVAAVDSGTGTATLKVFSNHTFTEGEKLYAVYCPAGASSDLQGSAESGGQEGFLSGVMSVDLSVQGADSMPYLLLSEAQVDGSGKVCFSFRNAASVVSVSAPEISAMNSNRTITKVIVSGHNIVSGGKISVVDGSLSFVGDVPSKFIEKKVGKPLVAGVSGGFTLEDPVRVVVPPCSVGKVTFVDSKGSIYSYDVADRTLDCSKHCRIRGKEFPLVQQPVNTDLCSGGVFWSDRNLGATSVSSGSAAHGDIYRWADGDELYSDKVYTNDVKSITLKPEYPDGFSAVAGQSYYNGSAYSKYNEADGKAVLDPVDDIVQLTYPGSGWRMPTIEEFKSLESGISGGSLTLEAGSSSSYINITDVDGNKLVFTRPYGAKGTSFNSDRGRYWSSTVVSAETDTKRYLKAHYFRVNSAAVTSGTQLRNFGYSVRPVKSSGVTPGASGGSDEPDLPNLNAGKSVADLPSWNNISIDWSNLTSTNHPRLFLRNKDIKSICENVNSAPDSYLATLHNGVLAGARAAVKNTAALKYEITVGGQLLQTSRKALQRIADLAYAYRVTGEDRFLEMADWNINAVCDFPDWHPDHFLDVAEMATAVAIGYDWLHDDLPESTIQKAEERLKSYALDQAESYGIYSRTGNWNQVCMGGLVCAALAVYEKYPEICDEVVRKALSSNAAEVKAIYSPSGAFPEGPGYWEYGTTYQGIMNLALETVLGTDFELPSIEGFDKTGLYYMYVRGNSGKRFNYSDSGEEDEVSIGMWYMSYKLKKPYYLYQDISKMSEAYFKSEKYAFMALTCCLKMGNFSVTAPSGNIYKANGANPILACRTGWGKDDLYLALKGGEANISHAHLDVGEVVFDAYGTRWFKDFTYSTDYGEMRSILQASGIDISELGNREQDSWRWKFFQYHNLRHSTITVDGKAHWPYGVATIDKIDEVSSAEGDTNSNVSSADGGVTGNASRLGGYVDLTNCFYSQLATGNRTAVIRDGSYLEITDVLTALPAASASIRWTCASDAKPELTDVGIVLTDVNGVKMLLSTTAPDASFKIWSVDPADSEDYTSPFTETADLHQNPLDGYLCGFEYTIPAGEKSSITTTLKRL